MGTAREVVSRYLKQFESNRWVQLNRGKIDNNNPKDLIGICEKKTAISGTSKKKEPLIRAYLIAPD